ncbi:hypothetical protein LEP1GSC203_2390 [Leptospira terpstrae serovar Hualin str. LT 11-33 = ATCC 700639]|uniref:Uncharacterized protein n=1 Tax=Leptospira terpstrae serovar Hualin str. LT 11-33 = ATCC 700639 TaxID=1257025 RepID=N1VRE8_9LEPT|nr:hypothetical protein LEP1GSC203_2390 [Leptospira terpstrae serovar Hualin str. LT 11-33 = ATCC 700639]
MIKQIAKKYIRNACGYEFNLNTTTPNKKRAVALKREDGKAIQKKGMSVRRSETNRT